VVRVFLRVWWFLWLVRAGGLWRSVFLPLMVQALSGEFRGFSFGLKLIVLVDAEESVVGLARVLSALTSLCELGLFHMSATLALAPAWNTSKEETRHHRVVWDCDFDQ